MEKLEETLEKAELGREEIKSLVERPFYKGLRLIEDKAYQGPTGIRFWM